MAAGAMTINSTADTREAYKRLHDAYQRCQRELSEALMMNKSLQTQTARQAGMLDAKIVSESYWRQVATDLTEANERYRRAAGEWKRAGKVVA